MVENRKYTLSHNICIVSGSPSGWGCFCKRDYVLPCYRCRVYFLFIALKSMVAFCKKVVAGFRFCC